MQSIHQSQSPGASRSALPHMLLSSIITAGTKEALGVLAVGVCVLMGDDDGDN